MCGWRITPLEFYKRWDFLASTAAAENCILKFCAKVALLYFHSKGTNEHSHVRDKICVKCSSRVTKLFFLNPDGQVDWATKYKVLLDEHKKVKQINMATVWLWISFPLFLFFCLFGFQTYNWIWSPNNSWFWLAVLHGPHQPCWFCYSSDKEWTALLQLWSGEWRHYHHDFQQNKWWPVAQGIIVTNAKLFFAMLRVSFVLP